MIYDNYIRRRTCKSDNAVRRSKEGMSLLKPKIDWNLIAEQQEKCISKKKKELRQFRSDIIKS